MRLRSIVREAITVTRSDNRTQMSEQRTPLVTLQRQKAQVLDEFRERFEAVLSGCRVRYRGPFFQANSRRDRIE